METIHYVPIGVIHTPFTEPRGVPIQPAAGKDIAGTVEISPAYAEGLHDLEGFSHLILLTHLHLAQGYRLRVKPFLDDVARGLFATRAPRRPNPIGLSVVRLVRIEGATLHILDVDMVDGTPLLDIKPFVPPFQPTEMEAVRIGWLAGKNAEIPEKRVDARFIETE